MAKKSMINREQRRQKLARQYANKRAELKAILNDPDAEFDRTVSLDAGQLSPQVTWGTSPEMVTGIEAVVPDPDAEPDSVRREGMRKALAYMDLRPGMPITAIHIR